MADGIKAPEGKIKYSSNRQWYLASPGSESMACMESRGVNVGDPVFSQICEYRPTSEKGKEGEKEHRKSDRP